MNLLFVCAGNVSRSFLAETLFRHEMGRLGRKGFSTGSAGLRAFPGSPPDPTMVQYLEGLEIPVPHHEARMLSPEDVDRAELILVMEKEQAEEIRRRWPDVQARVEMLSRYLPGLQGEDDIPDPFGRTPFHYRLAQSQITLAVRGLVKSL